MMQLRRLLVLQAVAAAAVLLGLVLLPQELVHTGTFYNGTTTTKIDRHVSYDNRSTSPGSQQPSYRNISIVAPTNSRIQAKVIILTYMRSGSSLTGDLFNHHPNAFYVYEPLWSLRRQYANGNPILFFNRSGERPKAERWFQPTSVASSSMKAFLACDFYSLDPMTLSQYHLTNSLTTAGYYDCRRRSVGILGVLHCLPLLFKSCRRTNVTAVKTIRFSMQQAASLMNADPKIKVIHLIRDPRPTLRSQISVGEFRRLDVLQGVTTFCHRVLTDLKLADKIKPFFPGRILTIRYEDLAMEPLIFAEKVLAFAGLSMDKQLRDYVWNITSAGLPNSCAICTTRSSSWKTAMAWRTRLNLTLSTMIDERCGEVYRRMGYLPLSSREEMVDWTVPAFLEHTRVPGLWV